MRTVITLTGALLVASSALAAPAAANSGNTCHDYYRFAERVMQGRQAGHPLPDMLSRIEGWHERPRLEEVILDAYAEPRYETRDFRLDAVSDFANEVMRHCLQTKRTP